MSKTLSGIYRDEQKKRGNREKTGTQRRKEGEKRKGQEGAKNVLVVIGHRKHRRSHHTASSISCTKHIIRHFKQGQTCAVKGIGPSVPQRNREVVCQGMSRQTYCLSSGEKTVSSTYCLSSGEHTVSSLLTSMSYTPDNDSHGRKHGGTPMMVPAARQCD